MKRLRTRVGDPELKIRIPKDLKERIEKEAKRNGRSRIAEILYRLTESLNKERQVSEGIDNSE